jgi:hypothetical protein
VKCVEIQAKGHHGLDYDDDFLESLNEFLISQTPQDMRQVNPSKIQQKPGIYLSPEELLKSNWLEDLGLEHLASSFILGGYFDLESMYELDPEILDVWNQFFFSTGL